MTAPYLSVSSLRAWYGESQVLHGLDFEAEKGQLVCLLGRNGAGKTTTFRSIMGLMKNTSGSIILDGTELKGRAPHLIARAGLGYCPEHRGIFGQLTVEENLALPVRHATTAFDIGRILTLFPHLGRRLAARGSQLSGGEQQMLAIARILLNGSRILLLDEPTEGLAPVIIDQIMDVIEELKAAGLTIILIEQRLDFALAVADYHYVIEAGRVVADFRPDAARKNVDTISRMLGV